MREPHWVKLFIRELERTSNVRLAAERAGVDFSTAYQRRKRHAEFAERWEGALAAFAANINPSMPQTARSPNEPGLQHPSYQGEGKSAPPPSANRPMVPLPVAAQQGGAEVVVRPDGKVIKGSDARWGKRAEERFLTELTVSGSVRRSASAAGFSTTAVYRQRAKSRHFAAAWDAAIETGKARVQAYLVEAASRTFDPDELPIGDERELPKVSISGAINIAKLKAAGPMASAEDEPVDEDHLKEVRERIIEKLERLRERDLRELGEAGWIEWALPPDPWGGDRGTMWLPPEYRLVGPEA